MAASKTAPATGAKETVVATGGDTTLVMREKSADTAKPQKVGEAGPPSVLEGGEGSIEQRAEAAKGQDYDVQLHTAEKGLEVKRVKAESGDEAAQKVLAGCNYRDASIRGVTPASDPDPNSLGGERDAAVMLDNAHNPGAIINTLGTEANAEATRRLAEGDISELKD